MNQKIKLSEKIVSDSDLKKLAGITGAEVRREGDKVFIEFDASKLWKLVQSSRVPSVIQQLAKDVLFNDVRGLNVSVDVYSKTGTK